MDINTLEEKLGIANLSDAEKLALVKGIESNVQASKAAVKAQEAGQYASLVVDAIKRIKNDLETRFNELNGIIDVKANSLQDGKDGLQGAKGEKGDRGFDGVNGKDGYNGKDGLDGVDGKDGVGVQDAYIDFDGSLIIKLTDGRELNVGEVVPMDIAEKIKVIGNGGGTSQSVLDAIAALQAVDATYGTMALQNKTSVDIEGGTIDNTVIGGTTPAAGTFTTLNANGLTTLRNTSGTNVAVFDDGISSDRYAFVRDTGGGAYLRFNSGGGGLRNATANGVTFQTNNGTTQAIVSHTASAVNYVQVTGAATGGRVTISSQGSDANVPMVIGTKGAGSLNVRTNDSATTQFAVTSTASAVNYINVTGAVTGSDPIVQALGSDTNIDLVLSPKGTGALQAQQTDSTATGGNARGANAVDWQTVRGSASQVASGGLSTLSGGTNNVVSGFNSTLSGGGFNTLSGSYSILAGGNSNSVTNQFASLLGGYTNSSSGWLNFVGGGSNNSGTSNSAVTTQSGTMNATTAVTLSGSNASIKVGQLITGTSIQTFPPTYVAAVSGTSLTLSQAASGSSTSTLSFYTPHGVVVGGGNNQATGSYSFIGGGGDAGTAANRNVASGDWSFVGGGMKNTASGIGSVVVGGGTFSGASSPNTASGAASFIGGGFNNTASNFASIVIGGNGNTSSGNYSFVTGVNGSTRSINNNFVISSNALSNTGDSQTAILVIRRQTTDATATVLTCDGSAATTNNQVILPNNSAYTFRGEIVSGVTGGGNSKSWTIEGLIKRGANAAATTLVGSTVTSMYADVGAATWTIALSADTTNGGLAVTFTGQAGTTIRTVCQVRTTEMTF